MKSRAEIEALKFSWKVDPSWDIEDTEGFEDHHDELLNYRNEIESLRERREMERLFGKASHLGVPGNIAIVQYIEGMEHRIMELESKVEQILPAVR